MDVKCISKCIQKGDIILHPITLTPITSINNDFCPSNFHLDKDNKLVIIKNCNISDNKTKFNMLAPNINYDGLTFLNKYYNINSFQEFVNYLKKDDINIYSKLRIADNAVNAWHAADIKLIQYPDFLKFYVKVINELWIKDIYKYVNKYIIIKDQKVYISHNINKKADNNNKIIKINYLLSNFNNINMLNKIFTDYFKYISNTSNKHKISQIFQHDKIFSHNINIQKFIINYIITLS